MRRDYYIRDNKGEIDMAAVEERLALIVNLEATRSSEQVSHKSAGRNWFTHTLDATFRFISRHARPLHVLGFTLTATILFIYARIVALTARLSTSGELMWPNVPAPSVVALWHGDAPSLIVAFAMRRTAAPAAILVASDPRGDYLALLCRMLGFEVVRTDGKHGGRNELTELAQKLKQGACVIITADGAGPARIAKWGAVALASATGVPLVPLKADATPALQQSRKWDAARNPLPFSSVSVWMGTPQRFDPFVEREAIEHARSWLEKTLISSESAGNRLSC
ncbi:MAG TPA: DUF374 domain-containing protein [Pyrinomonadaceae bacterium]|nr:DUF374 domain-containing protein [Pyrinomonadaceae bacterium]